jgi:hypothetical protein
MNVFAAADAGITTGSMVTGYTAPASSMIQESIAPSVARDAGSSLPSAENARRPVYAKAGVPPALVTVTDWPSAEEIVPSPVYRNVTCSGPVPGGLFRMVTPCSTPVSSFRYHSVYPGRAMVSSRPLACTTPRAAGMMLPSLPMPARVSLNVFSGSEKQAVPSAV